jgi:hypothetical protein
MVKSATPFSDPGGAIVLADLDHTRLRAADEANQDDCAA